MSSLSTLPKGDSAWLLRKAVERIMQQVSVLETNIGSSTTGNSANTQIIFNDAGTLRGDAGLTYNAATDTLTAGSATISGNVTIQTSALFVNSVNNRTGLGTTTPQNRLHIQGAGQNTVTPIVTGDASALSLIDANSAVNNGGMVLLGATSSNGNFGQVAIKSLLTNGLQNGVSDFGIFTKGAISDTTLTERFRIASDGVATWSNVGGVSGTVMTLNSSALSVGNGNFLLGASASGNGEKLNSNGTIVSSGQSIGGFTYNQGGFDYSTTTKNVRIFAGTTNATGSSISFITGASSTFVTSLTLDSSGNLIMLVPPTAPTVTNSQMVFNLTSNTNLRITVRGNDGTLRTANITLA